MATLGRRSSAKQWARLAMKAGLFLTDAKLWSAINEQLKERADDVGDAVRRGYSETSDRLDNAQAALRGESHWFASTMTFLGGVGIGIGLGMLLAPMSGEEARATIRDKAEDVRNRVGDFTGSSSRFRPSSASTGTEGD
jgi:gas vesicle protein